MKKSTEEERMKRFWSRVDIDGDCLVWDKPNNRGYGQVWIDGKVTSPHIVAYRTTIGTPPKGLELDHLCRNRLCVNPNHLEPVTPLENKMRSPLTVFNRTHCKRAGHPLSGDNLYVYKKDRRRLCKECARENTRNRRARLKLAAKTLGIGE